MSSTSERLIREQKAQELVAAALWDDKEAAFKLVKTLDILGCNIQLMKAARVVIGAQRMFEEKKDDTLS